MNISRSTISSPRVMRERSFRPLHGSSMRVRISARFSAGSRTSSARRSRWRWAMRRAGSRISPTARARSSVRAPEGSDAGDLLRMLSAITELEPRFRRSGQQQMLVETMLVRFALMDRTVSLEEVLRGLGPDGGGEDSGGRGAARATQPRIRAGAGASARARERIGGERERGDACSVRAAPAAPAAPAARSSRRVNAPDRPPLSVAALRERWESILATLRSDGRMTLVAALEHATPAEVSPVGRDHLRARRRVCESCEAPIVHGARESSRRSPRSSRARRASRCACRSRSAAARGRDAEIVGGGSEGGAAVIAAAARSVARRGRARARSRAHGLTIRVRCGAPLTRGSLRLRRRPFFGMSWLIS